MATRIWFQAKTLYYYQTALLEQKSFRGLDVYVTSHGGVGTTFVTNFLETLLKVNGGSGDRYHLIKHLPTPPMRAPREMKILYLFGDPVLATASLFRRGYAHLQGPKNGSFKPISASCSLEDYIDAGEDRLGLSRHFLRWTDILNIRCDTIAINWAHLWDEQPRLASFLGIGEADMDRFPSRKRRKSEDIALTKAQQVKAREMFKAYYERMEEIARGRVFRRR